jgi:hypothetical protein
MKFFMKMWKDPVWSKVIATVIIGVVVYFVPYLSNWFPHLRVFITSAWEQGISIYDIAIPIFFAFLTSIFSSILSEFLIVTKVFIKFRKTILTGQIFTFFVLISLLSLTVSGIYYVDAIQNLTSLVVRNLIFVISFVIFFLIQSPKKPIFSEEKLECLKKQSDSIDHSFEVNNLSKLFHDKNFEYPQNKLSKNIKNIIKKNYEKEINNTFPRFIPLKEISFEIKNGFISPVENALNNDDFVFEINIINRTTGSILSAEKIKFKYIKLAFEQKPIRAPEDNNYSFINLIAENAWKLQVLNETDSNKLIFRMSESDDNLIELKALFKNKKIDINFVASNGWTALLVSVANGADKTTKYLLQKAADPSLSNKHGASPLHFSSKYGNLYLSKLLIAYKANVNQLDAWGATSLMMASKYGHGDIVKILIENNANVTIQDTKNETAYTYAVKGNYGDIARYLKKCSMD